MKRIVVGVDASLGAAAALRWAIAEATAHGAALEVVHAWHVPYYPSAERFTADARIPPDWAEASAAEILDAALNDVDATGLAAPLQRRLVEGAAATVLIEAAKGADLLVVGSRGRGGFGGLLLGSVSQQVAHHAPCPVAVIPVAA